MTIMTISAVTAAIAGILLASHLGAVRGSTAFGWELDIITIVLLGGVSIFGGSGTMLGVFLSTLLVLNIRNGLGLPTCPVTPRPASSACCSSCRSSCPTSWSATRTGAASARWHRRLPPGAGLSGLAGRQGRRPMPWLRSGAGAGSVSTVR